jgi:hypothetical protein
MLSLLVHTMLQMMGGIIPCFTCIQPYFDKFDKIYWKSHEQHTMKQSDHMREHGIKGGPSFTKYTCNLSLTSFSFLIIIQISFPFQRCSFLCSVCKISISLMTCDS